MNMDVHGDQMSLCLSKVRSDETCIVSPCWYFVLMSICFYHLVNATTDLPGEIKITVLPSLPHLPGNGMFASYIYQNHTSYSCGTLLAPPAGDDAAYSCPDAGIYNLHTTFPMFGNSSAWYGNSHGFNVGLNIKVFDVKNNVDYGFCYVEMRVKEGIYDGTYSSSTDWAFLGGGLASVAAVGYMYRKRRIVTLDLHSESSEDCTTTNFELVSDQIANV
jgi:hypothetical protein